MRSRIRRSARPLYKGEAIAACRRARAFQIIGMMTHACERRGFLICTNGGKPHTCVPFKEQGHDARPAREFFSHPNTKELQGSHESLHGTTSLLIRFSCVPLRA